MFISSKFSHPVFLFGFIVLDFAFSCTYFRFLASFFSLFITTLNLSLITLVTIVHTRIIPFRFVIEILLCCCDLSSAHVDDYEKQGLDIQKAKFPGCRGKTRYEIILNGKWVNSRFVANIMK